MKSVRHCQFLITLFAVIWSGVPALAHTVVRCLEDSVAAILVPESVRERRYAVDPAAFANFSSRSRKEYLRQRRLGLSLVGKRIEGVSTHVSTSGVVEIVEVSTSSYRSFREGGTFLLVREVG